MNSIVRWVGGTALFSLTLAYALVPSPRDVSRSSTDDMSVRREAWQTSARDLQFMKLIRTRAVSKELARALPSALPPALPLALPSAQRFAATFRFEAPLTALSAARIERVMQNELDVLAPGGAAYPVAVIANVDSSALGDNYFRTVVLPEAPGQPCVVVFNISPRDVRWPGVAATDRLLGTCGFYAAFGEPGAANTRWLLATQMRAAVHLQRPAALAADTGRIDHKDLSRLGQSDVLSCQVGRADSCLALFSPAPPRFDDSYRWWWRPSREIFELERTGVPATALFGVNDGSMGTDWIAAGLLAELAADLGPERFGQLWRDDRPLPESYAELEGRPLAAWIQLYVSRRVTPFQPGSGLLPLPLALAIALTALATYVGIRLARREMS